MKQFFICAYYYLTICCSDEVASRPWMLKDTENLKHNYYDEHNSELFDDEISETDTMGKLNMDYLNLYSAIKHDPVGRKLKSDKYLEMKKKLYEPIQFMADDDMAAERVKSKSKKQGKSQNTDLNYEDYAMPNETGKLIAMGSTTKKEDNYDYFKMKNDYYDYIISTEDRNKTQYTTETNIKQNISHQEMNQRLNIFYRFLKLLNIDLQKRCSVNMYYNINDIICIINELNYTKTTDDFKKLRIHTIKTIQFWTLVYIFIGIPLWIWQGWCCCCLGFRICRRPTKIIQDTKTYIRKPFLENM